MVTKHSTSRSKTSKNKSPVRFSDRSEWSCWMNGADPEWFHTDEAKRLERVFGDHFPQWYIGSSPWVEITPQRFWTMRKLILGLTVAQCAAYLRVPQSHITAWESEKTPVPFSAYEALRLQSESCAGNMSHRVWDGWYIQRQTGALISPDNGNLAILPHELNTLALTYTRLSIAEEKCQQQELRINHLEAENARLRGGEKVRAVAAELESIQETIAELLGGLRTAEIHEFPFSETPARAIAGA